MERVLVTGAGGFLGGWVVECFGMAGIPVRAGIRSWKSAVRLARQPTEMVPCDVLSLKQLSAALQGCDAVVHCAVGDERVSIEGTRNLLKVARENQLRRIVHLSSVAVYGKSSGMISEVHPRRSRGNRYAKMKIEAEKVCEEFIALGTPVVILRPSIVYGPFSETWTVSFARRLSSGRWGTFGPTGEGKCNLVYVTDVVQAIYKALQSRDAPGEAFNVNGDDLHSWNDYFLRFNSALGREPLDRLRTWPIEAKAVVMAPVRTVGKLALSKFGRVIARLNATSSFAAKSMRATESALKLTPTREQLKLYRVDAEYVIEKARKLLGYSPRVNVSEGLSYSVSWLNRHGLLP